MLNKSPVQVLEQEDHLVIVLEAQVYSLEQVPPKNQKEAHLATKKTRLQLLPLVGYLEVK
jgi:hypothetical protein